MERKRISFGKIVLLILLVILLAVAGAAYYVYKTVNNYGQYEKYFVDYESELQKYEGSRFEDFITYEKNNNIFRYEVPAVYFYKIINKESMADYLGVPEDFELCDVAVVPDLHNMKAKIYVGFKYKNIIHSVMEINSDIVYAQDKNRMELRFSDYYLINDKVMEYAKDYIDIPKGDLMFTHEFPTFVIYYQMPDFKPEFVSDLECDGEYIRAKYDIKAALTKYKEENYDKKSLSEKLDAVWLEVRQAGVPFEQ